MKKDSLDLLKKLTEAHGAPGSEQEVREIFKAGVEGNKIFDKTGSVYVCREGCAEKPVLMLAAHLDEVGFAVQAITPEGYLKLIQLGQMWENTLLSQRVRILVDPMTEVSGIVAAKPSHFLTPKDKSTVVPTEKAYVDIGARSAEEVERKFNVRPGQPVVFDTPFGILNGTDFLSGKAFDNRAGVGIVMESARELLKIDHPNRVFCGANAQEEVGCRGAKTAACMISPDAAIIIEGPPADDLPENREGYTQCVPGKGVQVRVLDTGAILNKKFNDFIIKTAKDKGIPFQVAVRKSGTTDAKFIHLNETGVPAAVLGVPVRYSHTAVNMMNIRDYEACLNLVIEVTRRLDFKTCETFTDY